MKHPAPWLLLLLLLLLLPYVTGCHMTTPVRTAGAAQAWEMNALPPYRVSGAYVQHRRTRIMGIFCHEVVIPTQPTGCFVTFVFAQSFFRKHMPLSVLVSRSPVVPQVAVAGTFFDKRTWQPVGEIIVDRKPLHFGGVGHAFAVYPDKHTDILSAELNHRLPPGRYRNALRTGPRLIEDRRIRTDYRSQGFRDARVIKSTATRCAVGIRNNGMETVILVCPQSISLKTLSQMLLRIGCKDALNLDGGGSLSLYYRGRTLISPGRQLTNIIVAF